MNMLVFYPVRCAHIPPPCHFSVCFDFLFSWLQESCFLSAKLFFFRWFFEARAIVFEARALILEARGSIWTISGMVVWFYRKTCVRGPPPRCPWIHFLRSHELAVFFECSGFWIFVFLTTQRLHFGFHFHSFWGALGVLKSSWKCKTIMNFRGLTPFGQSLFPGLDRECVSRLSFYRFFTCWVVWGSQFWMLLLPLVVINQGAKNQGSNWIRLVSTKGVWAPENKTNKQQDQQITRHCLKHALACLSARWRIQ